MLSNFKFQISNFQLKKELFAGFLIVILFFLSRLYNLTNFPIFADEAIYIRWSQVLKSEPTLRFLPLSDGKQPLFMWILAPFLSIINDPLFAGRFLSVLTGFGSFIGIFILAWLLFKSIKISIISTVIYLLLPFTVFFDRMALVDSMLSMFGIWILIGSLILLRNNRYDLAMVLGFVLGGALLTKSPAIFFVMLIPTTIVLVLDKHLKISFKKFYKLIPFWIITYVLGFAIYNILRLGPNFHLLGSRNKDYIFSFSEVLSHPLNPFLPHVPQVLEWFVALSGRPIMFLFVIGLIIGIKKKSKEILLLSFWFFIPVISQMLIAKVFTSRYILFTIPYFIIISAYAFNFLLNYLGTFKIKFYYKYLLALVSLVIIFRPIIINDYYLLNDPQKAYLPNGERSGYLEEWSSGYGISEVRDYLKNLPRDQHIVVGTEGYFGTLPDGLQIYFDKDPVVTMIGVGLDLKVIPPQLLDSSSNKTPTYLVINESRIKIKNDPKLKLIFSVPKATNKKGVTDSLLFFQVI